METGKWQLLPRVFKHPSCEVLEVPLLAVLERVQVLREGEQDLELLREAVVGLGTRHTLNHFQASLHIYFYCFYFKNCQG